MEIKENDIRRDLWMLVHSNHKPLEMFNEIIKLWDKEHEKYADLIGASVAWKMTHSAGTILSLKKAIEPFVPMHYDIAERLDYVAAILGELQNHELMRDVTSIAQQYREEHFKNGGSVK